MRPFILFVSLLSLAWGCQRAAEQQPVTRIIFDTDMAPDYDDVGALTLLHAFADSGLVEIAATVSSNKTETAVPCIEVLNGYFGRPDIPLGVAKGIAPDINTWHKGLRWTEELPKLFPHSIKQSSDAPDAVAVYRKVLSESPDTSVVIVTVGFLSNIRDLLQSGADSISALTGKELISKKVKRMVTMGGFFPEGKEFNIEQDTLASKIVTEEMPVPIIFSGFEIGDKILTGSRVAALNDPQNPVSMVYAMSLAQDNPEGRQSWDQTAVLVGATGTEPYFDVERGNMIMLDGGVNTWEKSDTGRHYRLLFKRPVSEVTEKIEGLMMHKGH